MIEVNRKILLTVLALSAIMLATPLAGTVAAGMGQSKLSFQFFLQGLPIPGETKEADGNLIQRGWGFESLGDTFVLVDEGGADEELIEADYLDYEAIMDFQNHVEKGFLNVQVRETIYIYSDTEKQNLRGTLEIMALGTNKPENGGTFVGFSTGEFEGAKMLGTSAPLVAVGGNPNPPYYYLQLDRTGTVMGWP